MTGKFLLDTYALYFWVEGTNLPANLIELLDISLEQERLSVSSVSFWELALLKNKNRIAVKDLERWVTTLLDRVPLDLITPSWQDMVRSTALPGIHKDPFDRLLIAQAQSRELVLVTNDDDITKYKVKTMWK